MALRAVVFDYFGTLAPTRTEAEYRDGRARVAQALGVDADRFNDELHATAPERFLGVGATVEGSLRWLAHRLGVEPSAAALARATAERLRVELDFQRPRPEAVAVLDALRERDLVIGLISDCSAELPHHFPSSPLAARVDAAVFSFELGVCKPDAAIYVECCRRLGVEPAECAYVGDGGSNELDGARDVGMRAIHLAVPAEAAGLVYGRQRSWGGERITALDDVLNVL